jgi:hypothetical protein
MAHAAERNWCRVLIVYGIGERLPLFVETKTTLSVHSVRTEFNLSSLSKNGIYPNCQICDVYILYISLTCFTCEIPRIPAV